MEYQYRTKIGGTVALSNNFNNITNEFQSKHLYKIFFSRNNNLSINIDHIDYNLSSNQILAISPYQHIELPVSDTDNYLVVTFDSNFYCIYNHDDEVSCGGLLFTGGSNVPTLQMTEKESTSVESLFIGMANEFQIKDSLHEEMLRILLKRLIIICTRKARAIYNITDDNMKSSDLIRQYYMLVDRHFREKKLVKDYADMLNRSPKTISRIFSACELNSPLQVIHERITTEAKRLILYTDKSAKEIAYILGFEDLSIFSRFFKSATNSSLSEFRKTRK